ncbi:alpha/beta fold hydrolase [Amycolatopsis suaedae]|uniref:Alpha/beta hydrolase n=1 Tax=Amycolatopsis suaedae TaxID=2510978 RepID=A0A4Q7IYY3_9PSEU|nr:alpha/beta hydrolase [Amycolatopsis suaedae]RZQ59667.1 alpha/beta hydrolase [Amycolatopsis suaedae]
MLRGETRDVESAGLSLWTERFGEPGDPVVLLVMGTATQSIGWPDDLVRALTGAGRQVLRFDHRDTGRSDSVDFGTDPYTLDDMAADCVAVLDGWDVGAAHVVGASLGGALGQLLAVHRPERVRTLTTIMTSLMSFNPAPVWERALAGQAPDPDQLPPPTPEFLEMAMRMRSGPPEADADLAAVRLLHGDGLPFDEQAARANVELARDRARDPDKAGQHDLAGREMTEARQASLDAVTAPALVVHGTHDPLYQPAHAEALAGAIPGARLHIEQGMGHGFFAPGLPRRIGELIAAHTGGAA